MADREINEGKRDQGADRLEYCLGTPGPLKHQPDDWNEADHDGDPGEIAHPKLLRRRIEQRCIAIGQRLPVEKRQDDGAKVTECGEYEEARVTFGRLKMAGGTEPDE